jgi:hypothetical protein
LLIIIIQKKKNKQTTPWIFINTEEYFENNGTCRVMPTLNICFKQVYHRRTETLGNDKPVFTSQSSHIFCALCQDANKSLCHNYYLSDWVDLLITSWRMTGSRKSTQHHKWQDSSSTQCQRHKGRGQRPLTGRWLGWRWCAEGDFLIRICLPEWHYFQTGNIVAFLPQQHQPTLSPSECLSSSEKMKMKRMREKKGIFVFIWYVIILMTGTAIIK